MKRFLLTIVILTHNVLLLIAQNVSYNIRLNQVGLLPNAIKYAAVVNSQSDSFKIKTADLSTTIFRGQCLPPVYYSSSEETVRIADFTMLRTPGNYVLVVDDLGKSVAFSIKHDVLTTLSKAGIKAFYYNRASIALLSEYAGKYARAMGHPDTAVVVHPSAASVSRPAGTVLSSPYGWYDAGDYNKYIVNSGISVFTLLSAYETYPAYFDTLNLNIPESSNQIPDILDEALWNIKWMMTMQDTTDGGVYHKVTEAQFSAFEMPSKVTSTRYVTAKGTAATLDFAAVMAMTARIYRKYLPGLAEQALKQSLKAWKWAKSNPNVQFKNPSASGSYPAIGTGEYGDSNFSDEFAWCAAELYITTKESKYYNEIGLNLAFDVPGWPNVKTLGLLSLLVHKDSLTVEADTTLAKSKLIELVKSANNNAATSPYRIPGNYFNWGGNSGYANIGMLLMQAFKLTQNTAYFNAALSALDYLLGRNATSYCFVTGIGTKRPMNIHHRPSGADGIAEPVPGFLVGGPNPANIIDCGASQYPSTLPAKAYADLTCSYSTNEVAINWNAPLAFLTGAIQNEYLKNFTDTMPVYFLVSSPDISLPNKSGFKQQMVVEGNTAWTLLPTTDWIGLSAAQGNGSAVIQVYSNTDNPGDSARVGKIIVYSNGELTDSIAVTQYGIRKAFRIEAENYSNMVGLQTESTSDVGGGSSLGYVDIGDWVTYNIDISIAGVYNVTFRHAGMAADFDVSINDTFVQKISLPSSGSWQLWTSTTVQIPMTRGLHILKFRFNKQGTNLNWMQFNWTRELLITYKKLTDDIKIYPLPAEKLLNIEMQSLQGIEKIQLMSLEGKSLMCRDFHGKYSVSIDVSHLHKGVYILKLHSNAIVYMTKIVIR